MSMLSRNALSRPRSSLFSHRRFRAPDLGIRATASFSISRDDFVLCMGSCFARRVGDMLESCGVKHSFAHLTHRYSAFSILQALRWGLGVDGASFGRQHLISLDNGRVYDPHDRTRVHDGYESLDEAYATMAPRYERLGAYAKAADVFVMTLGLTEVWWDRKLGIPLNHAPPMGEVDRFADRFEVRATTHAENVHAIWDIIGLLRGVNDGVKIIVSVSPIPLSASFCHDDVFVGTAVGKATLRAAVHEALAALESAGVRYVDYFPSFEIVTFQRENVVYRDRRPDTGKPDFQHIREEFVEAAIRPVFIEGYLKDAVDRGGTLAA